MDKIYQLKITLRGSDPPIWRRFLVSEDVNLHRLHEIIQMVMGWEDDHLYAFVKGKNYNGHPELDCGRYSQNDEDNRETKGIILNKLVKNEKQSFRYDYDFGDNWEHDLILEKIMPKDSDKFYPVCIEGKNACPPEDIGGIYEYYDALKHLKEGNMDSDEIESTFGDEEFDPKEFDIDFINEELKSLFGINEELSDKYTDPVRQLIYLGRPEGDSYEKNWLDYSSLGITAKDISELIKLLSDEDLYFLGSENPGIWASLHAWRALGQLKATEAIGPIINLAEELKDDDWIMIEIPYVLGMIGENAIEPVKKYLEDKRKPESTKEMLSNGLEMIAYQNPSAKEKIVKIYSDLLDKATEKTKELNASIVKSLVQLKVLDSIESIRNAYNRNVVDCCIIGDLEDVEIYFGLRKERSTPSKNYLLEKYPFLSELKQESEKKVKVGRNEPCPCGSGKKYKKCCIDKE